MTSTESLDNLVHQHAGIAHQEAGRSEAHQRRGHLPMVSVVTQYVTGDISADLTTLVSSETLWVVRVGVLFRRWSAISCTDAAWMSHTVMSMLLGGVRRIGSEV